MTSCTCKTCSYEGSLPYRPGTPLDSILTDGWARGFAVSQTFSELKKMGFVVTPSAIQKRWNELEKEMIDFFDTQTKLNNPESEWAKEVASAEISVELFEEWNSDEDMPDTDDTAVVAGVIAGEPASEMLRKGAK